MDRQEIETKLAKLIIGRNTTPHLPVSLDGEILLEEHRDGEGHLKGVISVTIDEFLSLPAPETPAEQVEVLTGLPAKERRAQAAGLGVRLLSDLPALTHASFVNFDPDDRMGYRKYADKWRDEGLV